MMELLKRLQHSKMGYSGVLCSVSVLQHVVNELLTCNFKAEVFAEYIRCFGYCQYLFNLLHRCGRVASVAGSSIARKGLNWHSRHDRKALENKVSSGWEVSAEELAHVCLDCLIHQRPATLQEPLLLNSIVQMSCTDH